MSTPEVVSIDWGQPTRTTRSAQVWIVLTSLLLVLAASTMLFGLWPYYLQLRTPCAAVGICIPPSLFDHDVATLAQYGISLTTYASLMFLLQLAVHLGYLSLASVLFWRRRSDPMALCTVAVLAIQPIALSGYLTAIIDLESPERLLFYAAALTAKIVIILFFALFPTGSLEPRLLRWYLPLLIAIVTAAILIEVAFPLNRVARTLVFSVETFWMINLLLLQLYRYLRISTPKERRQTRWLMGALGIYCGYTIGFAWFIGMIGSPDGTLTLVRIGLFVLLYLLQFAVVCGMVVAFRRGLYNLERLIGRTVVYALLTGCVVTLYGLLVGGLSLLVRPADNTLAALLATGVIAIAFQPLRATLQRNVNRLLYGRRDDPREVIANLGRQLEGAVAADVVLPTIVATLVRELKLPYAAIVLDDTDDPATAIAGVPITPTLSLPLTNAGTMIGHLIVAARAPDEPFSPAERRLLEELARQAGTAVRAARLADQLQRSRERLVAAREEERRRLQRDLHDELGPTLASMTMQLDAARALLTDDRAASEELIGEVQAQLRETVGTVRRIVHQLRPPMLDQLGLLAAVREHSLRSERATSLRVQLTAPTQLPPLGAAVEVVAYYIVVEALNNATRHARAHHCLVRLEIAQGLQIAVEDDGVGLPDTPTPGIGIHSMQTRAAELGGWCSVATAPGGGVVVRAWLPLAETQARWHADRDVGSRASEAC